MRSPKHKVEVSKHAKQAGDRTINGAVSQAGGGNDGLQSSEKKPGGAVEANRV